MPNLEATLDRIKARIEQKTANKNILAASDPTYDIVDNSVTKSHALSRAYYRFGLVEKRCMEALVSKLNPLRNDNLQDIDLFAIDYAKTFGVSENNAYDQLSSAVDSLLNRVILIHEPTGEKTKLTLTARAVYCENVGRITVTFNPLIVPHLVGLRKQFSSYPLKIASSFSSSYTWRFYELLVSWAKNKSETDGLFVGWFNIAVDELRMMLGVPDSYKWGMFEEKVLKVATDELLEKTNVYTKIIRKKTGRKITHLTIEFIEGSAEKEA